MSEVQLRLLEIPDVMLIDLSPHADARGILVETFNQREFLASGIADTFVQDNTSRSLRPGTVRGLHFQNPPHAVSKLIRVTRGAILDVAVDIRVGSPTFGAHVAVELRPEPWQALFVPVGFAHGFCTLEPDTEVTYKMSDFWHSDSDSGLLWCDPELGIDWPVGLEEAVVSDKDKEQPALADLESQFDWMGR